MSARVRVVGIAGASCTGKSTLARNLSQCFDGQVHIVHQDDYYKTDLAAVPVAATGDVRWDHPDAIAVDAVLVALARASEDGAALVIVEGHLLPHFPQLLDKMELLIRLRRPHRLETLLARRRAKDNDGGEPDPPGYYSSVVLPQADETDRMVVAHSHWIATDGCTPDQVLAQARRLLSQASSPEGIGRS